MPLAAAATHMRSMQPCQATTRILTASARLLENLAAVLVYDQTAVPACVQRAAATLAGEVLATCQPAADRPRRAVSDDASPRQRTPFTRSIRLGRMG
ncbi:hypothetical protein [Pseudonocardia sp. NPDC049154]|uniref:hypothetical protein n=1 Tax=Pseudonocardia sp. NPDC049154 TaxID=3155501 RepID=UPI0033C0A4AB